MIFLWGICLALLIAVFPVDKYVVAIPIWVEGLLILFSIILCGLHVCRKLKRRRWKLLVSVTTILIVLGSALCCYCNPYYNSVMCRSAKTSKGRMETITFNEAKRDVNQAMYYLKKDHPACRDRISDNVMNEYEAQLSRLEKCDKITIDEEYKSLQSILSILKDAHTTAYYIGVKDHYLKDYIKKQMDGYDLVQVNGKPISDYLKKYSHLFCYETDSYGEALVKDMLTCYEELPLLGIDTNKKLEYLYTRSDATSLYKVYQKKDFVTQDQTQQINYNSGDIDLYRIDHNNDIAILTLSSCDFNDNYRKNLRTMFQEIKKQGINNVAVDLRDNGGGNSMVADEFIRYLDVDTYHVGAVNWRLGCFNYHMGNGVQNNEKYQDLLFKGHVYVLTSPNTFSSAMLFAEYIKDNHLGTIIGEAPGNTPAGYGEISEFQLPNSRLIFQVSTKQFLRADESAKSKLVDPDIPCKSVDVKTVLYEQLKK